VRELLTEIRAAARDAEADGAEKVLIEHLSVSAGLDLNQAAPAEKQQVDRRTPEPPTKESIERALADANGNVSAAARSLGLHRTQLRRWLSKHKIAVAELGTDTEGDDGSDSGD
jgi:ActR/RegA family two-component response regulator